MKLVRETLFEKFEEDSDPIEDMGIGIFSPRHFSSREEMIDFIFKHIRVITKYKGNLKGILEKHSDGSYGCISQPYWGMLSRYAEKFVIDYSVNQFHGWPYYNWLGILTDKLVKETLFEKFTEDSDPIHDMGIGQRAIIKKWFKTYEPNIKYTIDDNLNVIVGGSLNLRGTPITKLPDNLSVGGHLDLRGTKITELPDNLSVGGNLHLQRTNITKLPDNLSVGGDLDLEDTNISKLPNNLSVGGNLDLEGTNITKLPDNLSVGGNIYKDF